MSRMGVMIVVMVVLMITVACEETVENGPDVGEPVIFAHYYGWYSPDQWSQPITENPVLGLYNSRDSAVITQHIEWGKRAGITAFSVSWHGEGSVTDVQLKDHLKPGIESQVADDAAMQFMILFETPDILDVPHGSVIDFDEEFSPAMSRGDKFLEEMSYLADSYFSSAGYHKIDQQPVVFIYLMRDVINHQPYFDTLKSNMGAKGFDLYLIGDVIHWQNPVGGRTVQRSGPADWDFYKDNFKAISGYNLYDPSRYPANGMEDRFLSDVEAHWGIWEAQVNAYGLKFVPFIIPGYDDRNLRGSDRPVLGRDRGQFYRQHWAMAQPFISSDVPHVAITSFNEWYEGTEIEPSHRYGVSYLDSTKELSQRQNKRGTS